MVEIYDHWWLKGENGDQEMEENHYLAWQNVIHLMDKKDIEKKKILDFGCNQGGFLRQLYDHIPYKNAYGIDLAKEAIEIAKQRAKMYPITYAVGSNPAVFDCLFDTVISTSVLYLIEDLPEHFRLIGHVLREGGVYYASFSDQTKNPSATFMKEKIDRYGATKMQIKSLNEVVDGLVAQGFSVELIKEQQQPVYEVTSYKEFYLSVDDYLFSCDHSYLIKARKGGRK
ncbi:class I SAM-dependent methyltransferase [Enterococcus villorum]|uniref:class I SAM-dependent methyltransferase n=1 Tax=Enterococcus villorum TaxID=112904 RepID=UPI003F8A65EE